MAEESFTSAIAGLSPVNIKIDQKMIIGLI
jgi:hypothetical protein